LFLDEIGELPMPMQAKLLRVLEDRVVRRVGATSERKVDVRIIAATNNDLDEAVREKRFRQDLLFRLNACTLQIPPLRERKGDVRDSLRECERARIVEALQKCNGNQTQAAEMLGLPRRTLAYKMQRLGLRAK